MTRGGRRQDFPENPEPVSPEDLEDRQAIYDQVVGKFGPEAYAQDGETFSDWSYRVQGDGRLYIVQEEDKRSLQSVQAWKAAEEAGAVIVDNEQRGDTDPLEE